MHVLGSCTVYLHIRNKTFEVLCQVTNTDDCFLMGRTLAKAMGYVSYPEIQPPFKAEQTSIKTAQIEPGKLNASFSNLKSGSKPK